MTGSGRDRRQGDERERTAPETRGTFGGTRAMTFQIPGSPEPWTRSWPAAQRPCVANQRESLSRPTIHFAPMGGASSVAFFVALVKVLVRGHEDIGSVMNVAGARSTRS